VDPSHNRGNARLTAAGSLRRLASVGTHREPLPGGSSLATVSRRPNRRRES